MIENLIPAWQSITIFCRGESAICGDATDMGNGLDLF